MVQVMGPSAETTTISSTSYSGVKLRIFSGEPLVFSVLVVRRAVVGHVMIAVEPTGRDREAESLQLGSIGAEFVTTPVSGRKVDFIQRESFSVKSVQIGKSILQAESEPAYFVLSSASFAGSTRQSLACSFF